MPRQSFAPAVYGLIIFAVLANVMIGYRPPSQNQKDGVAHAQAAPAGQCKEIQLPAGQKLEGVSWACTPGGYCTPTWLTRPMRNDEVAETHTLSNAAGLDTYVISEHRSPTENDIHR
jgi:hypothetical protein